MRFFSAKSAFQAVREAGQGPHAFALVAVAAALWLVVAGIAAALLYGERTQVLERATRSAEALVSVLEAHTLRTYQAVDITLAGVADALRLAPDLQVSDTAFQEVLSRRLELLQPYVRTILVIGPDGRLVHDTNFPSAPDISTSDRAYFQAHRGDPAMVGAVWPPLRSRGGLGWFVAVTRRVGDDAQFRGIVLAALEPRFFELLFSQLGLDRADAIALYHRDGTLIARHPREEAQVGKSFADAPLFSRHLPRAPVGTYITDSGVFAFERVVSYRALEGMPLVVGMNQGTEGILEGWREAALAAAVGLGAFALLLAALVAQFLRQQRIRELARERRMRSEKLEALGHLTSGVTHDFANLLNVVSASLRVIQAAPLDAPRVREAASVGERAIVRGSHLIDQLRAFARRQPLHVHPADLNVLVAAAMELLRQASGQSVELRTELAPAVAPCLLDETELEVALVNLLVNARDSGARRIILKTYNCNDATDCVCLAVIDNGSGMSAEVRRRVFEPYFSTKGAQGTGLGLAQVYGFMRQVGGDVQVESQPGKGTTVYLIFPKAPLAAAVGQAQPA